MLPLIIMFPVNIKDKINVVNVATILQETAFAKLLKGFSTQTTNFQPD